jgi:hypothetical protein
MGMGTKEYESSTGHVLAPGYHHVTADSCLVRVLKLMNRLFLEFSNFGGSHSKLWITETVRTGSVDTGA